MKSFYAIRSKVVHGRPRGDDQEWRQELDRALSIGRELARDTLFALLARSAIKNETEWNRLLLADPIDGRKQ